MKPHLLLLKESTGLLTLAICVLVTGVNSMMFATAVALPVAPITRGGLVLNLIAAAVGWFAFIKGVRPGIPLQLFAVALISVVHFYFVSNLWAVIVHGL